MASPGSLRRAGVVDGPLPTHYEPIESVVANPLYGCGHQSGGEPLRAPGQSPGPRRSIRAFPYVLTTYRLTEHHTAGRHVAPRYPGSRKLQPSLFVELSPELAAELAIKPGAW